MPVLNAYQFEFADNRTLAGLAAAQRDLGGRPGVRRVVEDYLVTFEQNDAQNSSLTFTGPALTLPVGVAFQQSTIFQAIEAIRSTPPFCCDRNAFREVKVAVLDTGFAPRDITNFQFDELPIVRLFAPDLQGIYDTQPLPIFADPTGHGTAVTSIIAAVNNGGTADPVSGALNGVFRPGERPFNVDVYGLAAEGRSKIIDALTAVFGTGPSMSSTSVLVCS